MSKQPQDDPQKSPDLLGGPPRRGAGVRRLNRFPLLIALGVLSLVGVAFIYTLEQRTAQAMGAGKSGGSETPEGASAKNLLLGVQEAGAIEPAVQEEHRGPEGPVAVQPLFAQDDASSTLMGGDSSALAEPPEVQRRRERRLEELERRSQARQQALETALGAETRVAIAERQETSDGAAADRSALMAQVLQAGSDTAEGDPNLQSAKRAFLEQVRAASTGSRSKIERQPASSSHTLYEGTVIPAVLLGGIVSDLPGRLTAQVSENVYDTVSGRYVLVPQGSKLVGTYDSRVSQGQQRVLVAWTRLIYPDGSTVDLGSMPGVARSGASGLRDRANNHYPRVFANALLLSVLSAGLQLSQPRPKAGSTDLYSSQQIAAGAVGQQMGELGQEIARRGMDVQPTLEIRPGYRFSVMVTEDMELGPWQ